MPAPTLDLDWELGVFKALRSLWRALAPAPPPRLDADQAAQPGELEGRLRVMGSVLAGCPIRISTAREHGGVRGRDLLLPPSIALLPDPEANAGLYLLRVAISATIVRLDPDVPLDAGERFFAGLCAGRDAIALLGEELGGFGAALEAVVPALLAARPDGLSGRAAQEDALIRAVLCGEPISALSLVGLPVTGPPCPPPLLWGALIPVQVDSSEATSEEASTPASGGTEEDAPAFEALSVVIQDPDRVTELPVHVFEKVETLEAFSGSLRQLDGSDDLSEHLEALSEVDLSHLIRGGPQAHSLYRADISLGASVPDVGRIAPGEAAILYDEWDGRRRPIDLAGAASTPPGCPREMVAGQRRPAADTAG